MSTFCTHISKLCVTCKIPAYMKTLLISLILVAFLFGNALSQDSKVCLDQTYSRWIDSKFVGDKFLIKCYIPNQKTIPIDSLPMIFLLDADLLFGMTYDIVRWLKLENEIPYSAVIGISYGSNVSDWFRKRSRDFTPSQDQTKVWGEWPLAGGAENFKKFIEFELFKFVNDEFGLKNGTKTIIGGSFGGLICTDILFSNPSLFDNYIILCPALKWNDKEIFKKEAIYFKDHSDLNSNVFTAIGNLDEKNMTEPWTEFVNLIESRKYTGLTFQKWLIDNETHMSSFPSGITRGLKTVLMKK